MDEEDKLPLFGVQPEDFYNTEGQGTVGDTMLGGLGLSGAAFAAQTGRAPTPAPTGPMSSLAQQVSANDAANRAARTTQPRLIGQGTLSGPGRPVPGTTLAVPGTQVPATIGTGTQMVPSAPRPVPSTIQPRVGPTVIGELEPRTIGQSPASKITSGLLSGTIGAPSLVLNPTPLGDATVSGSIERLANQYMAQGMFFADAYNQAQRDMGIEAQPRSVAEIIESKNLRGPDAVFTQAELDEMDLAIGTRQAETAELEEKVQTQMPQMLEDMGEIAATPTLDVAQQREEIARGQAERGEPVMDTYLDTTGPSYRGTVVGTTPGGAIEFAPEGEGLIRTMDPVSGEVVFADPATVGRFAEQFREQRLAAQQAQQRAITSPEGRAMTERMLRQALQPGGYEAASAEREARIAARPDFGEATAPRTYGGYKSSQLRDMVGGGDKLKQAKALATAGRDPLTGEEIGSDELEQKRIELIDAQLAERGIRPSGPPQVDPVTGIITQMYTDGVPRMKGQVARGGGSGEFGQIIADSIAKGGTSPTMEKRRGDAAIPTINSQAEYDALPSGSQYYDSAGKLATKK